MLGTILVEDAIANHEGETSHMVHMWLKKMQTNVHGVKDMLDLVAFEKVQGRLEMQIQFSGSLRVTFSHSNPIILTQIMAHYIRRINDAIYVTDKLLSLVSEP